MIFTVIKTLITGIDVRGYSSLICVMLLIGGIQLIFLGVIGEYLERVFIEVKRRSLYFIYEYSGDDKYKEVTGDEITKNFDTVRKKI